MRNRATHQHMSGMKRGWGEWVGGWGGERERGRGGEGERDGRGGQEGYRASKGRREGGREQVRIETQIKRATESTPSPPLTTSSPA